ncbi:hypothetical protein [Oceanobacillus luteolus]|uniref:hypothetical protein n=1 Tax=Oceanobacillus luteolus TaxID=1274358 RepID=UPI0020425725|nr:hypothetical protein [Oceanobacillus luteolus]
MKKLLVKVLFAIILCSGILFIFADLLKEETFTIIEKDTDTFIWIESNKVFNPSYKRALLDIENARIINANGEEIDYRELLIGERIKAEFQPIAALRDPPGLVAREVKLLN